MSTIALFVGWLACFVFFVSPVSLHNTKINDTEIGVSRLLWWIDNNRWSITDRGIFASVPWHRDGDARGANDITYHVPIDLIPTYRHEIVKQQLLQLSYLTAAVVAGCCYATICHAHCEILYINITWLTCAVCLSRNLTAYWPVYSIHVFGLHCLC